MCQHLVFQQNKDPEHMAKYENNLCPGTSQSPKPYDNLWVNYSDGCM